MTRILFAAGLLAAGASGVVAQIESCCTMVSRIPELKGKVVFSGDHGFTESQSDYYSAQNSEVVPACHVEPESAEDVSKIISVIHQRSLTTQATQANCDFSVRGGGYTPWAGASNAEGGMTIDLNRLNHIHVDEKNKLVSAGGGSTFKDIYGSLKCSNPQLVINGGRIGLVGVGGTTIGGGIGYYFRRLGWISNSVRNFEMVLPNGTIVNVNKTSDINLNAAVRGGGNNFGVVTRLDYDAFEQPDFWGGFLNSPFSTYLDQVKAFTDFNEQAKHADKFNRDVAWYQLFFHKNGNTMVSNSLASFNTTSQPADFNNLATIQPQLSNSLRTSNFTDFADEQDANVAAETGMRHKILTTTWRNDLQTTSKIVEYWNQTVAYLAGVEGLTYYLALDGQTPAAYTHPTSREAQSLFTKSKAVQAQDGAFIVGQVGVTWKNKKDDDLVYAVTYQFIHGSEDRISKLLSTYSAFKLMNFADITQDVMLGLGKETVAFLYGVSVQIDPTGVFQKFIKGGFKIGWNGA